MLLQVVDNFPPGTATGCDYISGLPLGTITEDAPDGPFERPEKVMVTGADIPFEGPLCLGERTVRWMAHKLGMYDHWTVVELRYAHQAVVDERDLLSRELADARQHVLNLLELERDRVAEVFVAADGSRHASEAAAAEHGRRALGLGPAALEHVAPLAEVEPAVVVEAEPVVQEPEPATGIKGEAQKAAKARAEKKAAATR